MTSVTDDQRAALADELEMRGSPLCDCSGSPVTAHACDCAAVRASALVRRAASATRHTRECGCGTADREAALFWEPMLSARPGDPVPGPGLPGPGAC